MDLIISSKPIAPCVQEIRIEGELDFFTAPKVREAINKLMLKGCRNLIINLEKLQFVDSNGIVLLLHVFKQIRDCGGTLSFVNPVRRTRKIFDLTGLTRSPSFKMFDTEKDAVGGLQILSAECRKCAVFGMPFCSLIKSFSYVSGPCDSRVRLPWLSGWSPAREKYKSIL